MRGNAGVPVVDPIFAAGLVPPGDHGDGDEAAGVFKIRSDSRSGEPGLARCPSVNAASFVLMAGLLARQDRIFSSDNMGSACAFCRSIPDTRGIPQANLRR